MDKAGTKDNKKSSRIIKFKKPILAFVIIVTITVSVIAGVVFILKNPEKEVILHNPQLDMEAMCAGQKVTWDCIYFGSYPQTEVKDIDSEYSELQNEKSWDSNGDTVINGIKYRRMLKGDAADSEEGYRYYRWEDDTTYHYFRYEPIKWRVLKDDGDSVLLLSDIVLDCREYDTEDEGTTWDTSSIRSWLNGYASGINQSGSDYGADNFITDAFSIEEQSVIADTKVVSSNNINHSAEGGSDTIDKLFLLSEPELFDGGSGFVPDEEIYDEAKMCVGSDYAKAMGLWSNYAIEKNCNWWLRSQGEWGDVSMMATADGSISECYVKDRNIGVRVALNLNNAASGMHTYAGKVCSDGTVKEIAEPAEGISNPKAEKVMEIRKGQNVEWDCVYFGNYPQTEVKKTDRIYDELQSEEKWDSNGDAVIKGTKYHRMLKGDAVYASDTDTNRYSWEDDTTYHYFCYEPIKWRVLKTDGKRAMLLSDIVLDAAICNEKSENGSITWEENKARSWLNGYGPDANKEGIDYSDGGFINIAFTNREQAVISDTKVVNNNNLRYDTEGGNNTKDKLFLLSESEAFTKQAKIYGFSQNYFISDMSRRCKPSDYAKARGVALAASFRENCQWWLRTPGENSYCTAYVCGDGGIYTDGYFGMGECNGIRVAMNLNLESNALYNYAGTVYSGEEDRK